MRNFSSPSPFPCGDSPYGYGDCVFGHPFSHALKNIFFAKASQFSRARRANIPYLHTAIAVAIAFATAVVVSRSTAGCRIDAFVSQPLDSASASKRSTSAYRVLNASCLLTPPIPFASCTPPLPFASCLPAGCCVTPVVAPPPTPPRGFAPTSSSPSGCRNSQRPTCCATAASRPLATSVCLATCRLRLSARCRLITGCVIARRQCADVIAVDAQASLPSSQLRLLPSAIVTLLRIPIWIWGSPYRKVDHHFHMGI